VIFYLKTEEKKENTKKEGSGGEGGDRVRKGTEGGIKKKSKKTVVLHTKN